MFAQMLHINKRTLQRYRATKTLPFEMMYNRAWYREVDVLEFMKLHFNDNLIRKREQKSKSNEIVYLLFNVHNYKSCTVVMIEQDFL